MSVSPSRIAVLVAVVLAAILAAWTLTALGAAGQGLPRSPAHDRASADFSSADVHDLDQDASSWQVYALLTPTWIKENIQTPSMDGTSLRCSLTGGAPYSGIQCYRNLASEPGAVAFSLSLSFWFSPTTTFNNQGGPSTVQALEFKMSKWYQSERYEFALQWQNVGASPGDGAPQWRYWDAGHWASTGVTGTLAGEQWHSMTLEGKIVNGQVRYQRFVVDQHSHGLTATVPAAPAPGEPNRLAVAVQLNGNSIPSPYDVFVDQVNLVWQPIPTVAAYQAWHGLASHTSPSCGLPPYTSTDPIVISRHIQAARARGIGGFIVDWYGEPIANASNAGDRTFIDQATAELLQQSGPLGFHSAIMYDEGTLSQTEAATTTYTTRMISDLLYARQYFTLPGYLSVEGYPALFVFPYTNAEQHIDWPLVRDRLGITVTLLTKDPDPFRPERDVLFDGFYTWVQGWNSDGTDWGEEDLEWFYGVMAGPTYTGKVAVGGVWPGFDDTCASWGSGRYIWRRCGQTWRDTWQLAYENSPAIVMIDTWNDFEEGTDIEFGIGECLLWPNTDSSLPGAQLAYTHTLVNTGKFVDTFNISARSSGGWPLASSPVSATLPGHASSVLTVTLTVPATASGGVQDLMTITATSQISPTVYTSLVHTTTVLYGVYLPVVRKEQHPRPGHRDHHGRRVPGNHLGLVGVRPGIAQFMKARIPRRFRSHSIS